MEQQKSIIIALLCSMFFLQAAAQRLLTDGRLEYSITAEAITPAAAPLLSGFRHAAQTIWCKGLLVRQDFTSPLRVQTVLYNGANGHATLLREAGPEKYQWNADSAGFRTILAPRLPLQVTETGERREIGDWNCQGMQMILPAGDTIDVYYTRQYLPSVKSFDPVFEYLPGLPVEYTLRTNGLRITYRLERLQTGPVATSLFDVPRSGYIIRKVGL